MRFLPMVVVYYRYHGFRRSDQVMLRLLRRYWPLIPIVVIFVAAVSKEWSNKNTPQPPLYGAASQSPVLAASQPPTQANGVQSSAEQKPTAADQQKPNTDKQAVDQPPVTLKI